MVDSNSFEADVAYLKEQLPFVSTEEVESKLHEENAKCLQNYSKG